MPPGVLPIQDRPSRAHYKRFAGPKRRSCLPGGAARIVLLRPGGSYTGYCQDRSRSARLWKSCDMDRARAFNRERRPSGLRV